MLAPWKKSYDQPRQYIKKQRHHFADTGLSTILRAKDNGIWTREF